MIHKMTSKGMTEFDVMMIPKSKALFIIRGESESILQQLKELTPVIEPVVIGLQKCEKEKIISSFKNEPVPLIIHKRNYDDLMFLLTAVRKRQNPILLFTKD